MEERGSLCIEMHHLNALYNLNPTLPSRKHSPGEGDNSKRVILCLDKVA